MRRLVLIGASGHGKVCAEIAEMSREFDEIVFLDDDEGLHKCGKYSVEGTSEDIAKFIDNNTSFFVSIGNCSHRRRIQEMIESMGGRLTKLIHPSAVISDEAMVGDGCVVMPGAIINTGSVLGRGVIVNTSGSVDHDCKIGDYDHIAVGTHICGSVNVDSDTWIGAGAVIINNVTVCSHCLIGAGAVVVDDIYESGTYVGVPAKKK